jgi:hypothetical protein
MVTYLGHSFGTWTTPHFRLMFLEGRCPTAVQAQTGALLEHVYRRFYAEFTQAGFMLTPVDERLAWLVFDDAGLYREFALSVDGMDSSYLESYYSTKSNQVVVLQARKTDRPVLAVVTDARRPTGALARGLAGMDSQSPEGNARAPGGLLDVRRAVHEATHLLAFNSGLQKRGVMYPLWVSEGLATSLEADTVDSVGMAGENSRRLRQLHRAHETGRLMKTKEFVTLVSISATQAPAANDLYAQAWGFFRFLLQKHPAELRDYLKALTAANAEPRPVEVMLQEFTDAFGSVSAIDQEWTDYVKWLRPY